MGNNIVSQPAPSGNGTPLPPAGLNWALHVARSGWRVFPIRPGNKEPYSREATAAALGIDPAAPAGVRHARSDEPSVRALWAGERFNAWIGLAMGNGRLAIDCDEKNGKSGLATLAANGLTLPATAWQRTPSGGVHYIVATPSGTTAPTDQGDASGHGLGEGLDRRGDGGYIVLYDPSMISAPIAPAPAWSLINARVPNEHRSPLGTDRAPSFELVNKALWSIDPNGLNYDQWRNVSAAYRQAATGITDDAVIRMNWDGWCATYGKNDTTNNTKLWRSLDKGTGLGWAFLRDHAVRYGDLSDDDRARLSGLNGAPIIGRTIEDILNDAAKLTPNNADAITALCKEAGMLSPVHQETVLNAIRNATGIRITTLRKEASQTVDDTEPDHLTLARMTRSAIGSENVIYAENHYWVWENRGVWNKRDDIAIRKHVQTTLEASGHPVTATKVNGVTDIFRNEVYRPDHTFNTGNPDVVNCQNGELELTNIGWTLQHHRREHYRTTQISVTYNPNAQAPMFLTFLTDVFRDDQDKDYKIWSLLEMIGYTLMSHAKHERFIMLIGGGANGKSVLLSVIEALVGTKNVAGVQPSNFGNRFQRAHLHGKSANIVTELKQGEVIADAELKAITSGELTTVEDKNGHPFEMRAFATCWFGTNHLPHTRDFSDALFRRAIIITFNRKFANAEQDHNLKAKLTTELPGILNLALNSYARATINGFTEPQSSSHTKLKWRIEADQIAQFVQEQCIADPTGIVAVDEAYRMFGEWARRSGVRQIVGKQAMGDRLERLGYPRKRSNGSWITGLRIQTYVNYGGIL